MTRTRDKIERVSRIVLLIAASLLLTHCASARVETGPVESAYRPAPGSAILVSVRSGESVSDVARRYRVNAEDVVAMNGFRDRNQVVAGQRIYVPGYAAGATRLAAHATNPRLSDAGNALGSRVAVQKIAVNPLATPASYSISPPSNVILPKPRPTEDSRQVANTTEQSWRDYVPSLSQALGLSTNSAFIWPVSGRVISPFGQTTGGGRNDGINIAVPQGTPVRAAADGVVTYVGNELKGYGNLLLIKHDNGFVTAYAHADRIAVERGERVRRGDTVAYTGATGDVTQPQLHFEIRKDTKPVNPTAYLGATGNQANRLPKEPARS